MISDLSPSRPIDPLERAARLRADARRLLVYRSVLDDAIGRAWLATVDLLASGQVADEAYASLFGMLAEEATLPRSSARPVADPWQSHLLDRIVTDDNPFTRECRRTGSAPAGALTEAALADLSRLREIASFSGDALASAVCAASDAGDETISWSTLGGAEPLPAAGERASLIRRLAETTDWRPLLADLADHYARNGVGVFGRHRALHWHNGELRGIPNPDPITLDELVGYDLEREPLLRNTAHFLAGRRANNVLLYGDRGTGKSSTVKALLNERAHRDLRIVEVAKQDLGDFPAVVALLRGRPERFIVFVDDLSFDEQETQYKSLKAVLEGGIETRPDNVVLYATSNRRHLVQERFTDRSDSSAEIHGLDGVQEKLSLSDRFGITITFLAPDQDRYVAIVESLAVRERLAVEPDVLRAGAIRWAIWQNGRSGRAARQYIDDLLGELPSSPA